MVRRGGRLAALPLGAAGRSVAGWGRRALGGDPEALGRDALARNAEQVFAVPGGPADPLKDETFRFTEAWMRRQGHRIVSPFGAAHRGTGRSLDLPAEWMSLLRVTGGWMSVLARLDVTVPARGCAETWVAGFADPVSDSPAVRR